MRWEQHLPSDQEARREFDSHRREYIRFASLLRQDPLFVQILTKGCVTSRRISRRTLGAGGCRNGSSRWTAIAFRRRTVQSMTGCMSSRLRLDGLSIVSKFTSEPKCVPDWTLRSHGAAAGGVWWREALQGGGVAAGAATCLAAAVGNRSSQCFKGTLSDQAVLESRSRSKRRTWM